MSQTVQLLNEVSIMFPHTLLSVMMQQTQVYILDIKVQSLCGSDQLIHGHVNAADTSMKETDVGSYEESPACQTEHQLSENQAEE